jgi:tripartite-type tricarboxylate transporter receptor subunit TctC
MRRRQFVAGVLSTAAGLRMDSTRAEAFPNPSRTVRLIVPFAPGGGVDVLGRLYAEKLKERHGLTVVVENRAGANGTIGAASVLQSPADGYTLLISASTHAMARLVMRNVPHDPVADFTPIARVGEAPMILIMCAERPQKNIAEVVADAKARPGSWIFAASSVGSMGFLATLAFNELAGLNLTITTYRGTAPALTDVAGGHVHLMIDPVLALLPLAREGKVKALAITSAHRSKLASDIPTASESGLEGLEFVSWYGVWGPKGLPPGTVWWLNRALNEATVELAKSGRFAELGQEPVSGTPEEFAHYIDNDVTRTIELLKKTNFQPV